MLVLSRKRNEAICIGDNIRVRVLRVEGGRVYVGVDAPEEVKILRSEVAERASITVNTTPAVVEVAS